MSLRYSENMSLLSENIKTMEEIINSVGEPPDVRYSSPISKIVTNKLNKFGLFPSDVIAYYMSNCTLTAKMPPKISQGSVTLFQTNLKLILTVHPL